MRNIEEIIKDLTLEEKARLVNGASFFGMAAIHRLGIPGLQLLDGGTGINFEQLFGDIKEKNDLSTVSTNGMTGELALIHVIDYFYEPERLNEEEYPLYLAIKECLNQRTGNGAYAPACYPSGMLLGASWNEDAIEKMGQALGKEARFYQVDMLLGTPNVNLHRDPRNGRAFEGFSEDPCLVKKLAPSLVKGVQSQGVAANVKHFAANNQEMNRVGINEIISQRALQELYLPGFKACVQEGGARTVMSAYNKINGVPCTENHWLLTDLLREEWGFDGMVVSDWGAVANPVEALLAGNDLAMPGPSDWKPIAHAVEEGSVSMEMLDQSVRRILHLIGWIMENQQEKIHENVVELQEFTRKSAYDMAAEGIVLLKNEKAACQEQEGKKLLPLQEDTRLLVLGEEPEFLLSCGTGSAGITTNRLADMRKALRRNFHTNHIAFQDIRKNPDLAQSLVDQADCILYICKEIGMEGNDRKGIGLKSFDIEVLNHLIKINKEIVLILNTAGPVDLQGIEVDKISSILSVFLPGMEGAEALSDILIGKVNPSGKLPLTFPWEERDLPSYLNFPGDGYEVHYGEGIFVGYRYYDTLGRKPRYPFGYGLSYSRFKVGDLQHEDPYHYKISIENLGPYPGSEIIQLYVGDPYSTLRKPKKELKAFQKVFLEVGEKKEITFILEKEDFASYDGDLHQWTVEEGFYDIYIATSSAMEDIQTCARIYMDVTSPYSYGIQTTVKVFMENEELKACLYDFWKESQWDMGILKSNYQYTPAKKLVEILPEGEEAALNQFLEKIKKIKKK